MANPSSFFEKNNLKLLGGFILLWIFINFLQALFTGLYPDEAYYWIYSRKLQWGYFDHPPAVALSVKLGELFGHNSFCTRLGTVMLSASGVFFLFRALPREIVDTRIYIISFLSVILFHVYGFVATPDAALFFFTALFFYAYRLFLQKQNLRYTLFLALSIAGLLYSKYHGILPVFFTFLSNPRLIFKRSAWLVVLLASILFSPHLYWQYLNDWPTIRYHLSDRVASTYRISKTTNYILSQLLVWGPLTTIPIFYRFFKMGKQDAYLRAHQFCFWGVLLFFLLSSFTSAIEPHWTLVAGVSFIVLLMWVLHKSNTKFVKLFTQLAFINIMLALMLRVLLILPNSPVTKSANLKPLFYGKAWADSVYEYVQNTPVVFIDSYVLPSLYQYYHPTGFATSFNTIIYRKNHFSISDNEIMMNNKSVYVEVGSKIDSSDLFITSPYTNTYLHLVDSFKAVNSLRIKWKNIVKEARPGEKINVLLSVTNTATETIMADGLGINYTFFKTRKERMTSATMPLKEKRFEQGIEKSLSLIIQGPEKKGKYRLIFSIVYPPFMGTLASGYFVINVQ